MSAGFTFTVTDLALFLAKSPVTIRGWERQGLLTLPRDSSGARSMNISDVRNAANIAYELGRISDHRLRLIESALLILEYIERE